MPRPTAIFAFLAALGWAASAVVPASAEVPEVKLNVNAKCEGGEAQFEIVNAGDRWPAMATVKILRTDTRAEIAQREMRMAPGQRMVYRAKGAPSGTEVGLWIEPGWYERPFAFDAVIACVKAEAPAAAPAPAGAPPAAQPPAPAQPADKK